MMENRFGSSHRPAVLRADLAEGGPARQVARTLQFDADKYRCAGDEEANRMFTRDYRPPFAVPASV
jgi:hypothetical protein